MKIPFTKKPARGTLFSSTFIGKDFYRTSAYLVAAKKIAPTCIKYLMILMLSNLISVNGFAQGLKITGTVSDKSGNIPGVTIRVKNTTTFTTTNTSGKFSITVPNNKAVLVFSYIGYQTKELPVGSNTEINVAMTESSSDLNEVVVIGYGTTKKKDLTGSVGIVNMADVQKAPVTSVDQALAGRIAGVQVTSDDGQPGANAEIVVRGVGSVTQTASPLYVIDGFPQEDANFNSINPQDIASIEVLKDASATAIYGSRGANGVIIITTKRGTSPKPTITYNSNFGYQNSISTVKLMDAYNFVKLQNDINPYYTNYVYFSNGKTLEDYKNVPTIDWQGLLFNKNPSFQTQNISLTGRNGKTSYVISGNYTGQDGLIIKSGFNRKQGRIVLDQEINDKFKIGVNANYAATESYGAIPSVQATPTGNGSNLAAFNLMNVIWSYRPVLSSRATNPTFYLDQLYDTNPDDGGIIGTSSVNPYINTSNDINNRFSKTLTGNSYLDYRILKGLVLHVTAGINVVNNTNQAFHNSLTQSGSPVTSSGAVSLYGVNGSVANSQGFSFTNENTLNYSHSFNSKNFYSVLVGYTFQNSNSSANSFSAINLPNQSLGINGIGQGTPYQISSSSSLNALQSYLARINYTYNEKYLFTVNFRADGSSKFYVDNRWGYFPSGAFAWRLSEENFMKKITWIDDAKIRTSYGIIGNNRVSDFAYLSQLTTGTNTYTSFNEQNVYGTTVSTLSNNNLKWETTYETDLGLDLTLFKGRVTFTTDYYDRITKNLLLNAALPTSTGFSNAYENIGSVSNQGVEFTLSTVNIQKRDFSWLSSFNISFNKNRVLALTGGQTALLSSHSFESAETQANYIAKVGGPVAEFYGYIADGNYQYSDFYKIPNGSNGFYYVLKEGIPYYASKNSLANPATNSALVVQPGDPKFKDINGDGLLNANDYTSIGSPYPIFYGGLSNNFTYKGFDLSVFLQWSYGNKIMNANTLKFDGGTTAPQSGSSISANLGNVNNNMFASYENRWTPTNPSNDYPRVNAQTGGTRQFSTRIIEDGSFIRLKTVSFGYNLPKRFLDKFRIVNLRLSLSAQNLLTLTKYTGPDPEVSTAPGNNLTPGFDFSPYPRTRVYTLGVNLTF